MLSTKSIDAKLWTAFEKMVSYGDHARKFEDFVTIVLTQFMLGDEANKMHAEAMKSFQTEKEKDAMRDCYWTIISCYADGKELNGWYDPLGEMYMRMTNQWKSSAMGQFFTPIELCEMMASITPVQPHMSVYDPASGSGRTCLAIHAIEKQTLHLLEDLDPICTKMSALNMLFHGIHGEARCINTLTRQFYHGYRIEVTPEGVPFAIYYDNQRMSDFNWRKRAMEKRREQWLIDNPPVDDSIPQFLLDLEKWSIESQDDFFAQLEAMEV